MSLPIPAVNGPALRFGDFEYQLVAAYPGPHLVVRSVHGPAGWVSRSWTSPCAPAEAWTATLVEEQVRAGVRAIREGRGT